MVTAYASERTCAVDGCGRMHYGRGLCHTHYKRQLRTGSPGPGAIRTRLARDATCTVTGCDAPHEARGYCRTHYSQWRRNGQVRPAGPPNHQVCGISGCQQRHYGRGMCRSHYRRWQHAGVVRPILDITECAQLYRDGTSSAGLARLYGRTPHAILAALRAAGVQIRPPGRHTRRHHPMASPRNHGRDQTG